MPLRQQRARQAPRIGLQEVHEITLRRERHGHIELVTPCAHFWHIGTSPGHIGHVLDRSNRDQKRVLYYQAYVVVKSDAPRRLPEGAVLSEAEKRRLDAADFAFTALMGGECVRELLRKVDVQALSQELRERMRSRGRPPSPTGGHCISASTPCGTVPEPWLK